MSQDAGSHGFIHPSCAIRTPEDEGVHEMGFVATFQPDSRPLPLGYSDARACTAALRHWKNADFYARGTPLGAVTMRKVVTTDASLTGWGATQEGKTVNGLWPNRLRSAHINYLELFYQL